MTHQRKIDSSIFASAISRQTSPTSLFYGLVQKNGGSMEDIEGIKETDDLIGKLRTDRKNVMSSKPIHLPTPGKSAFM